MKSKLSQAQAWVGQFVLLGVVALLWLFGGWWTLAWLLCVASARLLFAGDWGRPWRGAIPGVPVAPQKGAMRHLMSGIAVLAVTYFAAVVAAFIGGDALDRTTGWYEVKELQSKSAAEGLLLPGDRILRYDGDALYAVEHSHPGKSLYSLVQDSHGRSITMTVHRAGRELNLELAARLDSELSSLEGEDRYRLGVAFDIGFDKGGLGTALANSWTRPAAGFGEFARLWWGWGNEVNEFSGPVGSITEVGRPTSPQAEGAMLLFVIGGAFFFAVDFIVGLLYWGHRWWLRRKTVEIHS